MVVRDGLTYPGFNLLLAVLPFADFALGDLILPDFSFDDLLFAVVAFGIVFV